MGFPIVVSPNSNFKNGIVVTIDATRNTAYKGEFKA